MLVRRLDPDVPIPTVAHPGDAGADLVTTVDVELGAGERATVPDRDRDRAAGRVRRRSCCRARVWRRVTGSAIVNAPGTVDAGYRGEIMVTLVNHDLGEPVRLHRGDRIAQLVVQRVEQAVFHEVDTLPGSARGEGGHGSTGGFAESSYGGVVTGRPIDDAP